MDAELDSRGRRTYRGLPGAFPYAFRASESRLFRSYAVVSGLLGIGIAVVFTLALVVWIAGTIDESALVTLVRSFLVLIGALVLIPLFAPVLFVARRHRRGTSVDERYDTALASAGYLFVLSLYVGVVISMPPEEQQSVSGSLAPFVDALYALPQFFGLLPPIVATALIFWLHRRLSDPSGNE